MDIKTPYIWKNGNFIDWDKAVDHNLTHSLHYGTGVFEGIRFYSTKNGPKIFRLQEHIKRLFYSASILELNIPFSQEEIIQAHIDSVKKSGIESGYLRPLIYHGTGKMGMNPSGAQTEVVISTWNWGKYLADKAIDVKVSKYKRMHPETADMNAKVSGGYYNSVLVSLEVKKENFDEGLLLDTHNFIAEGPGENIFFIKGTQIYTPETGTILPGITRATIIQIAKEKLHTEVIEEKISPDRLGEFDEAFFVGTAAEVTPIGSITYKGKKIYFTSGEETSLSHKIKNLYMNTVHGKDDNYKNRLR